MTLKLLTNFITINFRIASIVIRNNIDAIHANNLTPAVYILPVIKLFKLLKSRRKWVWSNHDLVYPDGVKMEKLAAKCVSIYDLTLAVSQAVKNKFDQRLHEKIEVLYNGLDLKKFAFDARLRDDFRERNGVDDNTIIFAIVGLIINRKGHLFLIEAFKKLSGYYNNVKLFIVGKELPNEAAYGAEVRAHEDGNNIRLLAYTENVLELYSGIDVLVNASLPEMSEPLGTTIYEAMAVSRVVIASDTGGGPEIVSDNINGYLFEAGNLNSLIEKMKLVLDNWRNQETARKNALKLVAEKFEIGIMVENYNKLLF